MLTQRLMAEFRIDIETWKGCGGTVEVTASCEDPLVMKRTLAQLPATVPQSVLNGGGRAFGRCGICWIDDGRAEIGYQGIRPGGWP